MTDRSHTPAPLQEGSFFQFIHHSGLSMLHMVLGLCLMVSATLFSACSNPEKVQNAQAFFTAFNHVLEADTLHLQGSYSMMDVKQNFEFYLDQKEQLNCALFLGSQNDPQHVIFCIKDGKTYLDYFGTTSQSVAENIGITKDTRLDVYNPFLDYTDQERADMFKSITKDGDTYTFTINPGNLSALLDSYGTAHVTSATMKAVIAEGQLKSLQFQMDGNVAALDKSGDLHMALDVQVDAMNTDLTIPWPAHLEDYGMEEATAQGTQA